MKFAVDEVYLGRFVTKDCNIYQYHSTMLDTHLFTLTLLFTKTTSGKSLGTFKQNNVLLAVEKHVIKINFTYSKLPKIKVIMSVSDEFYDYPSGQ
jgi:hypothetical protein